MWRRPPGPKLLCYRRKVVADLHYICLVLFMKNSPPIPPVPWQVLSGAPSVHDPAIEAEWFLALLAELGDFAMERVRAIHSQAMAATASGAAETAKPDESGESVEVFLRFARAVRHIVMLEVRIAEERKALGEGVTRKQLAQMTEAARRAAAVWRERWDQEEVTAKFIADQAVQIESDPSDGEDLLDDPDESLEDFDEQAAFANHPTDEVLAGVFRDLGLASD